MIGLDCKSASSTPNKGRRLPPTRPPTDPGTRRLVKGWARGFHVGTKEGSGTLGAFHATAPISCGTSQRANSAKGQGSGCVPLRSPVPMHAKVSCVGFVTMEYGVNFRRPSYGGSLRIEAKRSNRKCSEKPEDQRRQEFIHRTTANEELVKTLAHIQQSSLLKLVLSKVPMEAQTSLPKTGVTPWLPLGTALPGMTFCPEEHFFTCSA